MNGEIVKIIIDKIDTDKRFLLSVFNCDTGVYLHKYYPATTILEEFGSGVNFFEHLYASGYTHLNLSSYRKNGTGKIKDGNPITVNFSQDNHHEENVQIAGPTLPTQTVQTMQPQIIPTNDLASFGLNGAQIMEMYFEKRECERFRTENSELRIKNDRLQSENDKHREFELSSKYDWSKEQSKRESTQGLIKDCLTSLPTVMQMMKQEQGGLAGVVDFGSHIKNEFAEAIKTLDDQSVQVLINIKDALGTNIDFATDLAKLLKTHKLWE